MPRKLDREPPVPTELRLFAKNLKFARDEAKLSQRELAEKSSLSTHYLSMLETTQVNVGIDSMALISQALRIPLYKMFNPLFIKEFTEIPKEWTFYEPLIDNSEDIPFERKILAQNFRENRIEQGYMLKEALELTQVNRTFLVDFEKARCGISVDNAIKLSRFLMIPLPSLLLPKEIKQYTGFPNT